MVLANIEITDEEALQTAANGGPIDLYVNCYSKIPKHF
jgi:hypothetical protein